MDTYISNEGMPTAAVAASDVPILATPGTYLKGVTMFLGSAALGSLIGSAFAHFANRKMPSEVAKKRKK